MLNGSRRPARFSRPVRFSREVATLVLAGVAALGALGASLWPRLSDEWVRLLDTGDALVENRQPPPLPGLGETPLSPRIAYLLAFHHAQDRVEVGRMRIVAERLERIGETALAEHVRAAARSLEASGPGG